MVQFPHDVLVQAEVLLGCLRRESAVQVLTEAEVELAGIGLGGQWFRGFLVGAIQVGDDLGDEVAQATQRVFGRSCQPRQRRELHAGRDELAVLLDQVTR